MGTRSAPRPLFALAITELRSRMGNWIGLAVHFPHCLATTDQAQLLGRQSVVRNRHLDAIDDTLDLNGTQAVGLAPQFLDLSLNLKIVPCHWNGSRMREG